MLIIRLIKTGKKNSPAFRVVLTQKTAGPKSNGFLEVLGSYNPRLPAKGGSASGGKEVSLKKERIEHWLSKGAQVSDTVHNLLVREGVIKGEKIKIKLKAKKKGEKPEEQPASAKATADKEEVVEKEVKEEMKESADAEAMADKKEKHQEEPKKAPEENLDKPEPESKIEKE